MFKEITSFSPEDVEKNKLIAVLGNFYILFFLVFLVCPDSAFAKHHANRGLWLLIIGIVTSILNFIPIIGLILSGIIGTASLVFCILGAVWAAQGKSFEVPLLSIPLIK